MANSVDSQHDYTVPEPASTVPDAAAKGLDESAPPESEGRLNTAQPDAHDDRPGFGRLARKISSRTTDLLAITMVLLVGLAFGGQISYWWADDADDLGLQISPAPALPLGATPVVFEFGNSPHNISREVVSGGRHEMLTRLTDLCATVVANGHVRPVPSHPAVKRLLDQTQQLRPIRQKSNEWEVYAVDLQLTLVIGVRYFNQPNPFDQYEAEFADESGTLQMAAENNRRVVCWGFGFPSGKQNWTLYLVQFAEKRGETLPGLPQIALPDGSRKVLRLREASGGGLTAFEGEGRAEEWIRSFSGWFARHNWKEAAAWEQSTNGWSATFVPSEGGTSAGRVDVSFSRVGETGLNGIVSVTPPVQK